MDESLEVGDYVRIKEDGRWFEVLEINGNYVSLGIGVGGVTVSVRREVITICQRNP